MLAHNEGRNKDGRKYYADEGEDVGNVHILNIADCELWIADLFNPKSEIRNPKSKYFSA